MMRRAKILLMLCLSFLVIFMASCAKDSVEPQTKTPPSQPSTTVKKEQPKQETKKSMVTTKAESPAPSTKESPVKQTKKVTEQKTQPPTTPPAATANVVEVTATVQVSGYQGKTILSPTKVPIKQGDTVLSATQSILKAKGIAISVRGGGATAYVEGIHNLFEFDHGPTSGWIVYLNGKEISRSAGTMTVKKGDQILWKYSTEVTGSAG